MPVINSVISHDPIQYDGRCWFTEVHTLADASHRQFYYLDVATIDTAARIATHVAQINAEEIYNNDPQRYQDQIDQAQVQVDQLTTQINSIASLATSKGVSVTITPQPQPTPIIGTLSLKRVRRK